MHVKSKKPLLNIILMREPGEQTVKLALSSHFSLDLRYARRRDTELPRHFLQTQIGRDEKVGLRKPDLW